MKRWMLFVAAPVLAMPLTGCLELALVELAAAGSHRVETVRPTPVPAPGPVSSALSVQNGYIQGDMGSIVGFNGPATGQTVYGSSAQADVRVERTDSIGWAMTIVHFYGSIDDPALAAGAHIENAQLGFGTSGTSSMDVTGCSGPTQGNWTYDAPPQSLTVDVAPGTVTGSRRFTVTSVFLSTTNQPQTTTSSFDLIEQ